MSGLDIAKTERQLREHCESEGIDLDKLLDGASKHFQGPLQPPRKMTDQEFECLVEDLKYDPIGEALDAIDKEVRVVKEPTWGSE